MFQSSKKTAQLIYAKTGKVIGVVTASAVGFVNSAYAAVPAEVTTGITTAVTDVGTIGAAILGVVIVVAGFNWLRKPIH